MAKIFDRRIFDFTPVSSSTVTCGTINMADYGLTPSTQSVIVVEPWFYLYQDDTATSLGEVRQVRYAYTQQGAALVEMTGYSYLRYGQSDTFRILSFADSVTGLSVELSVQFAALTGTWLATMVADVTVFSEDI